MQQWEYLWITVRGTGVGQGVWDGITSQKLGKNVKTYLANLGKKGWELVSATTYSGSGSIELFFKRPKP